jgi:hypothetical protein
VAKKHIRIFILLGRRRILVNAIMKEMIYVVLVLLIVFSPLIGITVSGHLFDRIESPSYLNGLITATGVFVAFICATTISRAREIDKMDFLFVRVSLFMFIAAMFWLGYDSLRGFPNVILGNVGLLSTSLYLCGFTTWSIMHALFRKSHS